MNPLQPFQCKCHFVTHILRKYRLIKSNETKSIARYSEAWKFSVDGLLNESPTMQRKMFIQARDTIRNKAIIKKEKKNAVGNCNQCHDQGRK